MTVVTPKRFTIDEYHRLIELGFFTEGDKIELIRGELILRIAKGTPHTVCGSILCRQLDRLLGDRAVIRGHHPYQNAQGKYSYLSAQVYLPHQHILIPGFEPISLDLSRVLL
ncbi:hypothetical protein DSM106972_037420 [Dulcicalothrix desertica PCC 7102]|uniref:Restriction endonuclease domain-containing protein n=1 Tax=Dulcicalothrix desertica PCC 7102 TaxID=232991 RepID=A0A433VI44_9CYAN|nr:hypothetical protein [Dulcicalothrix desertica]RUT05735.1 hypothetical protein DSM106972_037420 [Dulcicalothrix desertica PCC 7102]TWH39599.1 hypothetical protein CAL7102_08847 [Dulcicalothrix desertica PCC 7102]